MEIRKGGKKHFDAVNRKKKFLPQQITCVAKTESKVVCFIEKKGNTNNTRNNETGSK